MASIRQRADKWQARIARKGFPSEVRSFNTRSEALRWAREVETAIDAGTFRSAGKVADLTLRELLQRYSEQVSPTKRGHAEEVIRVKALQRARLAGYSLSNLTPERVAAFRDERLRHVKAGAVIRDLSLLSSIINHARREWGVAIENPCALVRKPDLYLHQQGINTTTPAGKALFQMMGVFAEFEREMIRERVAAGLARAKAKGTKSGNPIGRPTVSAATEERIRKLRADGHGMLKVAKMVGCGVSVVQRIEARSGT